MWALWGNGSATGQTELSAGVCRLSGGFGLRKQVRFVTLEHPRQADDTGDHSDEQDGTDGAGDQIYRLAEK